MKKFLSLILICAFFTSIYSTAFAKNINGTEINMGKITKFSILGTEYYEGMEVIEKKNS